MSLNYRFPAFAVRFAVILSMQATHNFASEPDLAPVEFAQGDGRVTIAIDGLPVAMYCYQDDKITRPFLGEEQPPHARGLYHRRHQLYTLNGRVVGID